MLNKKNFIFAMVPAVFALQACSTSNELSEFEQLVADGNADLGDYGNEYNAAQAQYAESAEIKRRAERDLSRARDARREAGRAIDDAEERIEDAKEQMERAQQRMERAEAQYRESNATVEMRDN